jgi:hypothetical protein
MLPLSSTLAEQLIEEIKILTQQSAQKCEF